MNKKFKYCTKRSRVQREEFQLSVKIWAIYQLSVNSLLIINYAISLFLSDPKFSLKDTHNVKSKINSKIDTIITDFSQFWCKTIASDLLCF